MRQRSYWDSMARSYDNLYVDSWSQLENRVVIQRLRRHLSPSVRTVLDLGCGTGLGAWLIEEALGRRPEYHGVDISASMLEICRTHHPDAHLIRGSMTDLGGHFDVTFDAVTAFFASASYALSGEALLTSIGRVLKPGGTLYLSFLNRHSLRRVLTRHRGHFEAYNTRHADSPDPPPVRLYSRSELTELMADSWWSFAQSPHGLGALAGVVEIPVVWRLSTMLDSNLPQLSHLLDVVGNRGSPEHGT